MWENLKEKRFGSLNYLSQERLHSLLRQQLPHTRFGLNGVVTADDNSKGILLNENIFISSEINCAFYLSALV